MKVAFIGSRGLDNIDIERYMPRGITLIISGGARGVDSLAEAYADSHSIPKLIIKPDYETYGQSAPLIRNHIIVEKADLVIAIWDGYSGGTRHTIEYAKRTGTPIEVYIP